MTIRELAQTGELAQNAKAIEAIPSVGDNVLQPKMDGWRLIAEVRDDRVVFYARSGATHNGHLPAVEKVLLARFRPGTWLDGEAVALDRRDDGTVVSTWGTAQSVLTSGQIYDAIHRPTAHALAEKITYVVFDLIASADIDARGMAYSGRRKLLEKAFEAIPAGPVELIEELEATEANHLALVATGYEGSVLKSRTAKYASGKRGHGWFKRKAVATEDVIIMGFEAGKDVGAVLFGQMRDGQLVYRGKAKRKPNLIPTTGPEWLGKVVEVEFNGEMPGGALRHPRLLRLRPDKSPLQAVWEVA